jgi:hypothetical protein
MKSVYKSGGPFLKETIYSQTCLNWTPLGLKNLFGLHKFNLHRHLVNIFWYICVSEIWPDKVVAFGGSLTRETTVMCIMSNHWIMFMVFNASFNNISVISWWSVLLVEETGVPGENHRPVASHWQTLDIFVFILIHNILQEIQ